MLPRGVQHMRASGVSLFFSPLVSPSNDTCRWSVVLVFLFVCLLVVALLCVVLASCFASVIGFSQILRAY